MTLNVLLALPHIAVGAAFAAWLIPLAGAAFYFRPANVSRLPGATVSAAASGLREAMSTVNTWCVVFAAVDLAAHLFVWLFKLGPATSKAMLDSLFRFALLCFLGGTAGLMLCVAALVLRKSEADCVKLIAFARRLPARLVVIGLVSLAALAFLSF